MTNFLTGEVGVFASGWGFSNTNMSLVYTSGGGPIIPPEPGDPSNTPEPATLLMLGLGAIRAGIAIRRKTRNEK